MSSTLVELSGVTKAFPGVVALDDLDLEIAEGEVHAIVGLNGAGKSTLVNLLAGLVEPDAGTIRFHESASGRAVQGHIGLVPQEIVLVPDFSVGRNILLGMESAGPVRRRLDDGERRLVSQALARVGLDLDPETMPSICTIPELRMVQVAKALIAPGAVILLDEPTAVLPEADAELLLERIAALRDEGEAVVYVSHRIGEVLRLADQVTVLRDGRKIDTFHRGGVDRDELIDLLSKGAPRHGGGQQGTPEVGTERPALEMHHLSAPGFRDVTITVHTGEVVALVGVRDAGQSLVVQTLAGIRPPTGGQVLVDGEAVDLTSPTAAAAKGLVLVPANRREAGVVGAMTIRENIVLSPRSAAHRLGRRLRRSEQKTAGEYARRFGVKAPGTSTVVATLSGGNQQKVALAKALEARPDVLLLDEPTQGIDVATKGEILERIKGEARRSGRPVVAATSELEEIPGWADRVVVFRQGEVVGELPGAEVTEERLLELAVP